MTKKKDKPTNTYKFVITINASENPEYKIGTYLRSEFGNGSVRYLSPSAQAILDALQHIDDEIQELRCDLDRAQRYER